MDLQFHHRLSASVHVSAFAPFCAVIISLPSTIVPVTLLFRSVGQPSLYRSFQARFSTIYMQRQAWLNG